MTTFTNLAMAARLLLCGLLVIVGDFPKTSWAAGSDQIQLAPEPGAMQVNARVPGLDNQLFALGIPETIGCREAMLVNFPEARVEWQGPDADGAVSCTWSPGGRISYDLRLIPAEDYVDVEMTIQNHTEFLWRDVFAFNCLNPIQAPRFHDWKLERTFMSKNGQPFRMSRQRECVATCLRWSSTCLSAWRQATNRFLCADLALRAPTERTDHGS